MEQTMKETEPQGPRRLPPRSLQQQTISQQAFEQRTAKIIGDLTIENTKSKILIDKLQSEVESLSKEVVDSTAEIARLKAELIKAAESYKTLEQSKPTVVVNNTVTKAS